ncbi:MAG: dihydrodipicolinate synthase family protein [Desulfobacteraceae bacterium]|nr:dihydrodipicolinate synthase family protein [Desulfobacteraceae bacterium]
MQPVHQQRKDLMRTLFPQGVPRLWCALLTHYTDNGALDTRRIAAHIRHIRPWVPAVLAPGSTGDGWEMDNEEADALLAFLTEEARRQDFSLMTGVLRTETGTVVPAIHALLDGFTGGNTDPAALAALNICGFTITPPKGADLAQTLIHEELDAAARTGVPIALYQLPQITENEMSPETVESLVSRYPNIYLLKDTSGEDRVACSGRDLSNLWLVRGAEGDYAKWPKSGGGYYDGFLLSTANCFAQQLAAMLDHLDKGRTDAAQTLSDRVSRVTRRVFDAAAPLPFGNPFTNANKAIDHHFAWGEKAGDQPAPMTHSGNRLPDSLLVFARDQLRAEGFDIGSGYMHQGAATHSG